MSEYHLTDRQLVEYARDPSGDPAREAKSAHVAACRECAARLTAVKEFEEALGDEETWELADDAGDSAATLRAMRDFAMRVAAEDAAAKPLLKDFIDSPAALVFNDIARHRRYLTGGVVRLLTKTAQELCEREPLYAFNFADVADQVARALEDDVYPAGGIWELRGTASKARANALRYMGDFNEALLSLKDAERAYRHLPHAGIGLAAVHHVRATVLREQDEYDQALCEAEESARAYEHLGQTERYFTALNVKGQIYFDTQRYAEARDVFRQVLEYGENAPDETWIARGSLNLGNAYLELGDLTAAWEAFHSALRAFRVLNLPTEAARAEGSIGITMLRAGKYDEGIRRLRQVRATFMRHVMALDAAAATLYIVDALLAQRDTDSIPALTSELVDVFVNAGKLTGALTAIAYVKEAATVGQLTPARVEYVRRFLQRIARHPDLLFAPPPDSL